MEITISHKIPFLSPEEITMTRKEELRDQAIKEILLLTDAEIEQVLIQLNKQRKEESDNERKRS